METEQVIADVVVFNIAVNGGEDERVRVRELCAVVVLDLTIFLGGKGEGGGGGGGRSKQEILEEKRKEPNQGA